MPEAPLSPSSPRSRPAPARHRWFDPWLLPVGGKFTPVIEALKADIDAYQCSPEGGGRQRRRKPEDAEKFHAIVTAVVANLAVASFDPPETGRLATLTRNGEGRTRYDHPAFSTLFRAVLDALFALGYLDRSAPSTIRREASSIAPLPRWDAIAAALDLNADDFATSLDQEPIVLTGKTSRGDPMSAGHYVVRAPVDYRDNASTRRMREEMRRLNVYLASADITFVNDVQAPKVNVHDRFMRRRFILREGRPTPAFDEGGRLFGGFWQTMPSARRAGIRINGMQIITLDYRSMFTRLAYLETGTPPPPGDLYAIPGLEGYRSGVKLAMNAFLFDASPRRREWPAELGVGVGTDEDAANDPTGEAARHDARLPSGWTVGRMKAAILERHPALAAAWGRALGYRLMRVESDLLVDVLTRLMDLGLPALGLHDGLILQRPKAAVGQVLMMDVAEEQLGFRLPTTHNYPD